ncbi:restriction endonuclease subunit S [Bacillus pseudomycoides]|uniref:restriction endonuclease subunit S n=1 Tax=Bacillus TaxID=1386 RepID=UPI0022494C35|nr:MULTISPECIES: restriction endonuclease subunit S [Bacillus]MCX2828282.1 restriction endonuclease subunit S [Bacillus sp. DHT2]MDR4917354.1 restriction endonuclease subunit S [Bacillus pseudomycoides]
MNVPKLRFKGFEDEWKYEELSNLVTYIKGFAFKSSDYKCDGYRIIRVSDLLKESINETNDKIYIDKSRAEEFKKYQLQPEGIIVTTVGSKPELINSAVGRTIYYNDLKKEFLNQNLIKLTTKNKINSYFVYQNTKQKRYMNHIDSIQRGNANQSNITVAELLEYKMFMPTLEEQNKIADFFRELNKKIQLKQENINLLKEQKKGYMQKLFKQAVRFKDDNGGEYPKWRKKVKAAELFEAISNKNPEEKLPVLSATQDQGMVLRDLLNKDMQYSTTNLNSYKIVDIDDFVISLRSFQGGIELSHLKGLVSPAYTIFRKKNDDVCNNYFKYLFKTETFINQLKTATYGIRDGKSISYKDFSTLKFDLPSYAEQRKIVDFLSKLDEKIQIEEQKLDSLQEQKKGFMQQMFI